MTTLREAAQQALEALAVATNCLDGYYIPRGKPTLPEIEDAIAALRAALVEDSMQKFTDVNQELEAALAEPTIQTCNCRWDGETQVQQCTLHEAHVDAIHEWAERAKVAEKKLAALAEPVQEPVAWGLFAKVGRDFVLQHPVRFSEIDVEDDRLMYARDTATEIRPLYTAPPQRSATV